MEFTILERVMEANENAAKEIRARLAQKHVLMLNLISSPGSGKTSLLEHTLRTLQHTWKIAVIEGDVATDHDARRLQGFDAQIVLINTEGGCHLTAPSIDSALDQIDLEHLDIVFIENVGNLVCPSGFDLGEDAKIAIVSTAEGDDKPAKYPLLFRQAELAILNKIDLLPYLNFERAQFYNYMQNLNAELTVIETSCTSGEGLEEWYARLATLLAAKNSLNVA